MPPELRASLTILSNPKVRVADNANPSILTISFRCRRGVIGERESRQFTSSLDCLSYPSLLGHTTLAISI